MGRTRPPYPAEFRREAVRLVGSGERAIPALARELGGSAQSLRTWPRIPVDIIDPARKMNPPDEPHLSPQRGETPAYPAPSRCIAAARDAATQSMSPTGRRRRRCSDDVVHAHSQLVTARR